MRIPTGAEFDKALEKLIAGEGSVTATAKRLKVARETVSAWSNGRYRPNHFIMRAVIDQSKLVNL